MRERRNENVSSARRKMLVLSPPIFDRMPPSPPWLQNTVPDGVSEIFSPSSVSAPEIARFNVV
jgi:hypothetical protein